MKKLLVLVGIILSIGMYAQKPLAITKDKDEFTGSISYNINQVCSFESDGKAEMLLLPNLDSATEIGFLGAVVTRIGCLDDAQIYILLEDGEVINKTMFNKFNCDGLAGFKLNKMEWAMLAIKKVAKVKISNKGKSVIGEPDNPEYFIQLHVLLNK